MIPDLHFLSSIVKHSNVNIHLSSFIQICPQCLSILRIITSSIKLFSSIVNYRNTNRCCDQNMCCFIKFFFSLPITISMQCSGVIMIVNKVTHIFQIISTCISCPSVIISSNISHIMAIPKQSIFYPKIKWIV